MERWNSLSRELITQDGGGDSLIPYDDLLYHNVVYFVFYHKLNRVLCVATALVTTTQTVNRERD